MTWRFPGPDAKLCRVLIFAAFAGLAGCNRPVPHIVIDDWYDAENAKIDCLADAQMHAGPPCKPDEIEKVHAFQDQIANDIASDSRCSFIAVDVFTGAGTPPQDEEDGETWTLMLDFSTTRKAQKWTLAREYPEILEGTDDGQGIARRICSLLKSRQSIFEKYFS